jgi:hypothetical protein
MFYSVELYGWKTEKFKNSYTVLAISVSGPYGCPESGL